MNAIIGALDAHTTMSKQVLNSIALRKKAFHDPHGHNARCD
jgi:hypothetical protein